jgi:hypothetical protein
VEEFQWPMHVRGDHGKENLEITTQTMLLHRGIPDPNYIPHAGEHPALPAFTCGSSKHNQHVEGRDVTQKVSGYSSQNGRKRVSYTRITYRTCILYINDSPQLLLVFVEFTAPKINFFHCPKIFFTGEKKKSRPGEKNQYLPIWDAITM